MSIPSKSRITFEVRLSRSNEQTTDVIRTVFSTLPMHFDNFHFFWKEAETIICEYISVGQIIYTHITVPSYLETYIKSQLTAAYPELLIKKLKNESNIAFADQLPWATGKLVFTAPSIYPIKTYKEVGKNDPLISVLSVLSKLKESESAIIQIVVQKAKDSWKRTGYLQTQQNTYERDAVVRTKIDQQGFCAEIRILTSASSPLQAKILLHAIAEAYGGYTSPTNSLRLKKSFLSSSSLKYAITSKEPHSPFFHRQYFSLDELITLFHLPNKQLAGIKNIAWGKILLGEPPENLPTFLHTPDNGKDKLNVFAQTIYKNTEHIFGIKHDDRRRHMYILGKSGTGKSTLLANMIINDLKQNEGLAVIDPHGDLIETILNYIPQHRINDVIVFDPADPKAVVKLNLFDGGTIVHRELIASGIIAIFQKLYAYSWGPRLEYILRNALLTLLDQHAKLGDVLRLLTDKLFRQHVVNTLEDPILKNFWNAEFDAMPEKLRQEAISPILNKIGQFITSPLIRNVVNNTSSSFSIEDVMNKGKILLVNVSQGKLGESNAALLGAMVITQMQLAAMNRVYIPENQRKDFFLYIDEFQNFATTSFVKVLSEARKYRLNLSLSNQYIAQIPEEIQKAIFGNVGTIASFLVGADDANKMKQEFENLYTTEDLVALGRYQIILKLLINGEASRPFPAFTLPLATSSNSNKNKVLRTSRERYAKSF